MLPISVCIIAKNEEERIERCLASLMKYDFEIVLVDTGSSDHTKELAASYTSKIFDFVWDDDFSAARNFSLQMASNEWIFMLDCDEWIETTDLDELQYFMTHLSHAAGSVTRNNLTGTPDHPGHTSDQTERFFPKSLYYYTGTIHEQLTPMKVGSFETFLLNTIIGHDGYCMTAAVRQEKAHRNISLLQKQILSQPDNPYLYYQLGKGYEMISDYEHAVQYYQVGISYPLNCSLAYVQAMVVSYGYALIHIDRLQEALLFENLYDDFSDSADFTYLLGLIYENNGFFDKALSFFMKASEFTTARESGVNSFLSYYHIGCILNRQNLSSLASEYFRLCGNYAPALEELRSCSD